MNTAHKSVAINKLNRSEPNRAQIGIIDAPAQTKLFPILVGEEMLKLQMYSAEFGENGFGLNLLEK